MSKSFKREAFNRSYNHANFESDELTKIEAELAGFPEDLVYEIWANFDSMEEQHLFSNTKKNGFYVQYKGSQYILWGKNGRVQVDTAPDPKSSAVRSKPSEINKIRQVVALMEKRKALRVQHYEEWRETKSNYQRVMREVTNHIPLPERTEIILRITEALQEVMLDFPHR